MYIKELDKVYNELKISTFENKDIKIELAEIRGVYYITFEQEDIVKKVTTFDDLSISLNVYHSLIEKHTLSNLH